MKYFFITLLIFLSSCSSSQKEKDFNSLIANGKCEEAIQNIPDTTKHKIGNTLKMSTAGTTSYLLTGTGYLVDYVILIGSGVATLAISCGPSIAASIAAKGAGQIQCLPIGFLKDTKLGPKIYEQTSELRCQNIDHISKAMRKISGCYSDSGKNEKAKKQLLTIIKDPYYQKCLSAGEMNLVSEQFDSLK